MIINSSPIRQIIEFFGQLAADHNYLGIVLVLSGPILLVLCSIIESVVDEAKEKRKEKET